MEAKVEEENLMLLSYSLARNSECVVDRKEINKEIFQKARLNNSIKSMTKMMKMGYF